MNGLLENIRESFDQVAEQRRMEDLTRPRELQRHEVGLPVDLPTSTESLPAPGAPTPAGMQPSPAPAGASPETPNPTPPAPPTLNVAPPPRNVERIER